MSFIEKLLFRDLVFMLEKSATASATAKEKYMKKYFEKTLELQKKYKKEHPNNDSSIYPLIRILLSTVEHERAYGIQEKSLRKVLINSLKIGGDDAKKIEQCNENDIATTVYEIAHARNSRESNLTIKDIDNVLNKICENQKQQSQQQQFEYLFISGSASDLKWIVKIVLKNMKLKVSANKILENYHPLAPKLFTKFNQLSKVCEIIENGEAEECSKDVVKPFIPIRSMLSQKFSRDMNNIIEKFEFHQEIKLDGERFQLHMENGIYKYFSRNAHDFSDGFNILVTPLVKFKVVTHSIILDGEMVIWNKSKKRFVTKGETELDLKKMKDPNHYLRPCFCAFDLLYLNGVSYIDQPFSTRCEILASLFDDQEGIMIKTKPIKIRDVEHLVTLFNEAMQHEEEGIILKKSASIYMPGEREKGGWYKVKADYFDGELVKDFDCLIVGGKFQNPHKRDFLKTFQVGAVEKTSEATHNVYVIGEVTHGLSVANRMKINDKLLPFFINYRNEKEIEFEKGRIFFGREKPDIFIPPHKSIVLQIRISELTKSHDFYANHTFRFPRISEIRFDKIWDESVSLKEFQDVFKGDTDDRRVRKVNQRNVHRDDIVSPTRKNRRVATSRSTAIAMFCHDSQDDLEPIDNALEAKEFCVLSSSANLPLIRDLKVLLRIHGGTITEFPRRNKTFAIIAGELEQKIKIYVNEKSFDVIKADWVVDNLEMDGILKDFPELHPRDFHSMTDEMRDSFAAQFDEFGDSFTDFLKSTDELMRILNGMDAKKSMDHQEYVNFEAEIYDENFPNPNFFRGFSANFSENPSNFLMETAKSIFKYRAGRTATESCDFLFVDKCEFKNKNQLELSSKKLIDYRFILDSNDAGKLLNLDDYIVVL